MFNEKAWYGFFFAAQVCVGPFLNVHFRANGLQDAQIGVITALRPWVSAPAAFVWSALADRYEVHQLLLLSTFITSTLGTLAFYWITSFWSCTVLTVLTQAIGAPVCVLADAVVNANCKEPGAYGKVRLWGAVGWGIMSTVAGYLTSVFGMASAFILYAVLSIPCVYFSMQLSYGLLHTHKEPEVKAREMTSASPRVLARKSARQDAHEEGAAAGNFTRGKSITQVISASDYRSGASQRGTAQQGASRSTDVPPVPPDSEITPLTRSDSQDSHSAHSTHSQQHMAAGMARRATPGWATPGQEGPPVELDFWSKLRMLLTKPEVLVFMMIATLMGFGLGAIDANLFLFLDELGGSTTLMGLTLTVTCMSELPAFHYQGRIMAWLGIPNMLHLVMVTYAIRLGAYSLLPSFGTPWAVLPIELLHGITFATGWGAGTTHCANIAPQGLQATMQGIFSGLYFGLGQGLGALLSGFISSAIGHQAMFALTALVVMCAWGFILLVDVLRIHGSGAWAQLLAAAGLTRPGHDRQRISYAELQPAMSPSSSGSLP